MEKQKPEQEPPKRPVNPYIKEYAAMLATHHVEYKDPENPEAAWKMSLTDGVPIPDEPTYGPGWPE